MQTEIVYFFRWLKDEEQKLPEESDKDNIASLKEKEGKIAVSSIYTTYRTLGRVSGEFSCAKV